MFEPYEVTIGKNLCLSTYLKPNDIGKMIEKINHNISKNYNLTHDYILNLSNKYMHVYNSGTLLNDDKETNLKDAYRKCNLSHDDTCNYMLYIPFLKIIEKLVTYDILYKNEILNLENEIKRCIEDNEDNKLEKNNYQNDIHEIFNDINIFLNQDDLYMKNLINRNHIENIYSGGDKNPHVLDFLKHF
jgi:hypothetical protein